MKYPLTFLFLLAMIARLPGAAPASRHNVVLVMTDDQGWGDLSLHGNGNLQTPHIDSLARTVVDRDLLS